MTTIVKKQLVSQRAKETQYYTFIHCELGNNKRRTPKVKRELNFATKKKKKNNEIINRKNNQFQEDVVGNMAAQRPDASESLAPAKFLSSSSMPIDTIAAIIQKHLKTQKKENVDKIL